MRKRVPSFSVLLSVIVVLLVASVPALAADRYELILAGRSYVPAEVKLARAENSHLVVQFYDIPSEAQRAELAEAGITLLDYIPNYAWTAHVRGGAVQSLEPGLVRAVFELRAEDKIRQSATGREVVRAFVYDGVENPEAVLTQYGSVTDRDRTGYTLVLEGDLLDLASEDIVKCVMGPRPEMIVNNDELRDNINADEVQVAPYNLKGNGLFAGIWDGGTAATNHDDYNSRLTLGDGSSTHYHATKCIGILGGDGTRSSAEGGSPYQWRGVATEVDLASYDWPYDLTDMDTETAHAISNYDIVVSSNSWSWGLCPDYCEYFSEYDDYSWNYDRLVRGSGGKKLSIVFSAGNDGNCTECAGDLPDFPYGTIPGPGSSAKNTICVGSNNANNDELSSYSSRGPTLDGRLKPDIVAPGCKSYEGITTTYLNNDYSGTSCGTSFSCPAVSGCVVLTQEDYIDKFGGEAWPSTVKALLIQGAEDQGNPGPDFEFGYGRVNIQSTIDIVRDDGGASDLIKEDTLSPAETWEYDIVVTPGADLKVTLVWDDFEGDWGAGGAMLVNDLDLELEAPGGGIYRPWVLDPGNPGTNASAGTDHLNNVEQVEVPSPTPGTWTIRVTATVMPEPNQDFSVVTNFAGGAPDLPPAPPTGLDAVPGSGEGEIDASWNANSEPDLDHYRLERDESASFTSPASFTTTGISFADSGLTPGDTYYYRVFAIDAGGNESAPSGVEFAVATDLAPSMPTGLNAVTGSGEGEIDISWSASPEPDFDHYRLERSLAPDFEPGSEPFEGAVASYTDTGLIPGELYYYRVYAVDAGGNVSAPSEADFANALDLPPAVPTGLTAVPGAGEGEIDVGWEANGESDLDHYRLERDESESFTSPASFMTDEVYFTDVGLTSGNAYYYRLFAVDAGGNESGPSAAESAVATDLPPGAPTGLVAVTGSGEGEIDISWSVSPEPDIDRYRLERSLAPDFEPGSEPFEEPAVSFTDTGLIPGELYYYRVYAIDAGGNISVPSEVDSAIALDLPPAVPTGLTVVPGAGEGEIDVSWDPNSEGDFDHYRLERHTDPGFGPGSDPFDTPATFFPDSGLVPGEPYYYRVIAVDANGNESDPSAVESAVATDLPPGAPTGLTADPGTNEGDVDLSWDANPEGDLDHYLLERDTDPVFDTPVYYSVLGTTYTDDGLPLGVLYYYRVSAVDVGGYTSETSGFETSYPRDLPPGAPTGLVAVTGTGEGEIDISWDANPEGDLDHYRLERDTDGGFASPTSIDGIAGTVFADSGLVPGQTYHYRVFAVDQSTNEGGASNIDLATALDLPPAAPTGLAAVEGAGDGDVDVSWDANGEGDLDHYRVERDTTGTFGAGTVEFSTSGTSLLDPGLGPDTYYYRVFALDVGGNESAASDTVNITLEQTGVEELTVAGVSFIRPNPFTTQTAIHYTVPSEGADVTLRLYDIRGRLVRTLIDRREGGGAHETAWDGRDSRGSTVSSGIYFARVSIGEWGETRKIAYVR